MARTTETDRRIRRARDHARRLGFTIEKADAFQVRDPEGGYRKELDILRSGNTGQKGYTLHEVEVFLLFCEQAAARQALTSE